MTTSTRLRIGAALAAVAGAGLMGASLVNLDESDRKPWFSPSRENKVISPMVGSSQAIDLGAKVFAQHCLACHGKTGKGDGEAGLLLSPLPGDLSRPYNWAETDGGLFWKVTRGRAPMTAFETLTSEQDRWNVIAYIRSLAQEPGHMSPAQPADEAARSAVSGVLKQYNRLIMSMITGSEAGATRQVGKVSKKLIDLAAIANDSSQWQSAVAATQSANERLSGIKFGASAGHDAVAELSEAIIELTEVFGHNEPVAPVVLSAGGRRWLQLTGPIWSPYGDDRADTKVVHFIDLVQSASLSQDGQATPKGGDQ